MSESLRDRCPVVNGAWRSLLSVMALCVTVPVFRTQANREHSADHRSWAYR